MKQWENDFMEYAKKKYYGGYNLWKKFAETGTCRGLDCNYCPYLGKCSDVDFQKVLNIEYCTVLI